MGLKNDYENCLNTMYGLRRFGIILGLSTIESILGGLGNPHKTFSSIHVAGTNGKGSVASALSAILQRAGYKVGLYTSPHLVRFNERICIDNRPISDEDVVGAYEAVKTVYFGSREPTFFEFSTAMAFYEFGRQNVDWAVIETGMGGRLDATNVITPEISIITNISLEHQSYLGGTLAEIAGEKGGIIKKRVPVITGVKQKRVINVLKKLAEENSAPFFQYGVDFKTRRTEKGFTYFGIRNTMRNMSTGLRGAYQIGNAALTIAACEMLDPKATIRAEHVKSGLEENTWPGRLETVRLADDSPLILLDGAHNLDAAKNLSVFLSSGMAGKKITLVIGILDDKPYAAILKNLLPVCHRVILTRAKTERALPTETLREASKPYVDDISARDDVGEALSHAMETTSSDGVICVAGSLYVVGEAKAVIEGKGKSPYVI